MLQLNHANLPVRDVPALRDFFVRHFGFRVTTTRPSDDFVVMQGEGGFRLNLIRAHPGDTGYPRDFHVGFLVGSPEIVRAKHAELVAAGIRAGEVEELARGGESSVTFYCHAPNGILLEVGCVIR